MKENAFLISFYYLLIFIKANQLLEEKEQIIMNCYYSEENKNFRVDEANKRDENAIASAIYNKSYDKIGWDYLAISSYDKKDYKYNDTLKAYAMGYLEGILTKNRIYSHYTNFIHYFLYDYRYLQEALEIFFNFLLENIRYMNETSYKNMDSDPYWEHVHYVYQQLIGLYDGYMSVAQKEEEIEFRKFLVLLDTPDAQDIAKYLLKNIRPNFEKMTKEEIERFSVLDTHCSALVKLSKDFNDIWFGHNTWNYYILMIRIFKEYRFVSNKGNEKSKLSIFSSYPGALSSIDEFYFLDSKLLIMGTSNSVYNNDLYDLIKYDSILVWARQIVANRLASSAENWTEIFKRENSGTNNGQTMILDINKIDFKNKLIPNKTLMIIEQIPGYTETVDVTNYLINGYWPSYNVPFIDKIYKDSGYSIIHNEEGLPENVDYTQCPRGKIFKRDQSIINSNEDFKKFIRYNDYEKDEYSKNDSTKAIASRGDLLSNHKSCHGAIDAKFISVKEILNGKYIAHIISGPTNDQQSTFSWLNTTCESNLEKLSHVGINDIWNFSWVDYKFQLFDNNNNNSENNNNSKNNNNSDNNKKFTKLLIIWIIVGIVVLTIIIIIVILLAKNWNNLGNLNKEINKLSFQEEESSENIINNDEKI